MLCMSLKMTSAKNTYFVILIIENMNEQNKPYNSNKTQSLNEMSLNAKTSDLCSDFQ